jgi:hypothetical protein
MLELEAKEAAAKTPIALCRRAVISVVARRRHFNFLPRRPATSSSCLVPLMEYQIMSRGEKSKRNTTTLLH